MTTTYKYSREKESNQCGQTRLTNDDQKAGQEIEDDNDDDNGGTRNDSNNR